MDGTAAGWFRRISALIGSGLTLQLHTFLNLTL